MAKWANGGLWVVASLAAMSGVGAIVAVAAAHVAPTAEVRQLWAEGLVVVAVALSLLALLVNRADERRLAAQRLRAARARKPSATSVLVNEVAQQGPPTETLDMVRISRVMFAPCAALLAWRDEAERSQSANAFGA